MATQQEIPTQSMPDISFVWLIPIFREHIKLVISVFTAVFLVFLAYAVLSTPIYRSTVLLSPVSGGAPVSGNIGRLLRTFGGAGGVGSGSFAVRNSRAENLATLSSPFFTRSYIADKNLLPILFSEKWNADKKTWKVPEDEIPTLSDGYQYFSTEVLSIVDDEATGLVSLSIEWTDPELTSIWANQLIESVNLKLQTNAINDANLTIEYLTNELAKTNAVELQQAIYYLIEGEIQTRTMARVKDDYAFKIISPAIAPDVSNFVRPNRLLILVFGVVFGLLISLLSMSIAESLKKSKVKV